MNQIATIPENSVILFSRIAHFRSIESVLEKEYFCKCWRVPEKGKKSRFFFFFFFFFHTTSKTEQTMTIMKRRYFKFGDMFHYFIDVFGDFCV